MSKSLLCNRSYQDLVTTLLQVSGTIVGLNFVNNNECFNLALLDLKNSENRFC